MSAIDRIAPTRRPSEKPSGVQRWRELFFLHWDVDVDALREIVPAGIELDLWEGRALVGLVPFRMEGVRPSWLPFSMDFLETNLRTYVVVNGEPGVFFFSLEAASWLAVKAARIGWGLPYFFASMTSERDGDRIRYRSSRREAPAAELVLDASIGEALGPSVPGSLEFFLLERYLLFNAWGGRIYRGQVHHVPYPAARATVHAVQNTLFQAAGLSAASGAPIAHYSAGVDVEVFGPHPLR